MDPDVVWDTRIPTFTEREKEKLESTLFSTGPTQNMKMTHSQHAALILDQHAWLPVTDPPPPHSLLSQSLSDGSVGSKRRAELLPAVL